MNFKIDNQILNLKNLEKNNFEIKSHPKNYGVSINNEIPLVAFKGLYRDGDVVLIDKKLMNLHQFFMLPETVKTYPIVAIEKNKTIETCLELVSFLSENGFNKANTLHVIGGGIIQDIGSFTSAIYKRGIDWILYPSTLLSMCDSCIGGKNGINFKGAKNQLALFSSPKQVVICTKFIDTLEDREIKSGLGEILKLVSMGGKSMIENYCSVVKNGSVKSTDIYIDLIRDSLCVKKQVIEEDEFELTIRKSLNYGHTIGHALEVMSGHEIPHGEAVAIGMLLVNKMYKFDLDLLNQACYDIIDKDRIKNLDTSNLRQLILKDKKTFGNKTTFIALKNYGETVFIDEIVDDKLIENILFEIQSVS